MTRRPFRLAAGLLGGFLCLCWTVRSQDNPAFNVNLVFDYTAAEQSIALYKDRWVNTAALAELRGNRIAASTTGLIAESRTVPALLQSYLDSLRSHDIIRQDIYNLETARKNVATIEEMVTELKKRNFSQSVVATVEQIFPDNASVNVTIPVYVVALGHENVDAYVRRIVWENDAPRFVGESQGELTIVINLAGSVQYGRSLNERLISLLGVVAHEVFHAAFSSFKEHAPSWQRFYREHHTPFDALVDLVQNEGIAYYLSLDQQGRGALPRDWNARMGDVFAAFNKNAGEMLTSQITPHRAEQLLRAANLSGYWESYGAMTGMYMARAIDTRLGRGALIKTIGSDPYGFFRSYLTVVKEDSNFPTFSNTVLSAISSN